MKRITTKSIILTRVNYAEADRIITFLTPANGKVRAIAKGVRKAKSKLAGGVELFSISDIGVIEGRGEIGTLVSSRLVTYFDRIVSDINRTMLGYEMLKIINRALEDEGGEEFFELLCDSFSILNNLEAAIELAETSFLMRLMGLLGHEPNLTTEVQGKPLTEGKLYLFNLDNMGLALSERGNLNQNHIKLLRLLSHNKPETLLVVQGLSKHLKELAPLVRSMARQYVVR